MVRRKHKEKTFVAELEIGLKARTRSCIREVGQTRTLQNGITKLGHDQSFQNLH